MERRANRQAALQNDAEVHEHRVRLRENAGTNVSMRRDEHSGFIPFLDGIRAVAVLLVVAEHNLVGVWVRIAGYLGVSLFFVLSGYLITTIALREEGKTGTVSLESFLYPSDVSHLPTLLHRPCGVLCACSCPAPIGQ